MGFSIDAFFALDVWQKFYGRRGNPMIKWYWVPFYGCHFTIGWSHSGAH
eukprot:SAG11_NODE_37985_length_254_cov_0.967742_1_plen_48_part_10